MRGGGGQFQKNKQEFKCIEESTSVSGLVFFGGCWFWLIFLKGTELYCMFIFNPENLYKQGRKISSTRCSLEYKTSKLGL